MISTDHKEGAIARYSIGVDFHKAYSYMTVMDAQGEVVKAGKVANTREAVQGFLTPYRDNAEAVLEATRNWTVMYDLLDWKSGPSTMPTR